MVSAEEIERINELARKQKTDGLTAAEAEEQKKLRRKYIQAVKSSLRSQLDRIEIVDDDENPPQKH